MSEKSGMSPTSNVSLVDIPESLSKDTHQGDIYGSEGIVAKSTVQNVPDIPKPLNQQEVSLLYGWSFRRDFPW